jgi:hypothetical protein
LSVAAVHCRVRDVCATVEALSPLGTAGGSVSTHADVDAAREVRDVEALPEVSRVSTANVYDVPQVRPLTAYVSELVCPSRVPFR